MISAYWIPVIFIVMSAICFLFSGFFKEKKRDSNIFSIQIEDRPKFVILIINEKYYSISKDDITKLLSILEENKPTFNNAYKEFLNP